MAVSDGHARRPLLDRLVDSEPWQQHDRSRGGGRTVDRTLDRDGLIESVRRELERLFSCRSPLTLAQLEDPHRERTVVDYGIPELAPSAAASPQDRHRLAAILRATVAAYEPRLREVAVTVEADPQRPRALRVHLGARLLVESVWEPVWFPILLPASGDARPRVDAVRPEVERGH